MQVDALHGSVDGVEPGLGAAVGLGEQLVELADNLGDAAEDDALGRGEAAVGAALADECSDEGEQVNGLHVEAGGVNVHGHLGLEHIHLCEVRLLAPEVDDVVRLLGVDGQELGAELAAHLGEAVELALLGRRRLAVAEGKSRVIVSAHADGTMLVHTLVDAVADLCVTLAHAHVE